MSSSMMSKTGTETETIKSKNGTTIIYYGRLPLCKDSNNGGGGETPKATVDDSEDEFANPADCPIKANLRRVHLLLVDVIVKNAVSPVNFTIQNYRQSKNLESLEERMTSFYNTSKIPPLTFGDLVLHGYYAVKYLTQLIIETQKEKIEKESWVRCQIMKPFNKNMSILTYLIDHGIYYPTQANCIQPLKKTFLKMHVQSYEAKLHFIEISQHQFTPEDCRRFHEEVEGKPFCGIIINSTQPNLKVKAKRDEKLSIILIDTTQEKKKDRYIHKDFLIKK